MRVEHVDGEAIDLGDLRAPSLAPVLQNGGQGIGEGVAAENTPEQEFGVCVGLDDLLSRHPEDRDERAAVGHRGSDVVDAERDVHRAEPILRRYGVVALRTVAVFEQFE